ncbi:MAG: signal peptide peptidase SppA, partial [Planctomycetota bacterium]|nr:signal peptide peptidase SppA [Planctomycetota bacterium]
MSFYVAIFLGLLLLVSGGLNLLLLVFSAIGSAAGGFGGGAIEDDGGMYEMIVVGGDPDADVSVMRIPVQGAIMEGASPLLGAPGGMVSQVKRGLRVAAQTRNVRGVLLDINSPGGGVTDSDEIHRLILKFKEENDIEVLALFGDMAASGGYYIAAACDKIVARPTTITGSIGVIMSSYNYGDALRDLGIEPVVLKSPNTPFKDILSPTRTMEDEERQKLLAIIEEMYQRFVDIVDQGRPDLSRQEVQDLATGEIYSAMQAHRNGL